MQSGGVSFDEAFKLVGGHGSFQLKSSIGLWLSLLHGFILLFGFQYSLTIPSLICKDKAGLETCSEETACRVGEFIFDPHEIKSAVSEWTLLCGMKYHIFILIAIVGVGFSIGILVLGKLAEIYGRKKTLFFGIIHSASTGFVLICSRTPWFFSTIMFFCSLSLPASIIIPYVWIFELSDKPFRPIFYLLNTVLVTMAFAIAYAASNYFLSWRASVIASVIFGLIAIFPLRSLKESPRFLACNLGRYSKARKILKFISEVNKKESFQEKLEGEAFNEYEKAGKISTHVSDQPSGATAVLALDESTLEKEKHEDKGIHIGFKYVFFSRRLRKMLFRCSFSWLIVGFELGIIVSQSKYFINYSLFELTISCILCLLLSTQAAIFGNKIGTRRSTMIASAFFIIACAIPLLTYIDSPMLKTVSSYGLIITFPAIFSVITFLFIITQESFPTYGRCLASFLCLFFMICSFAIGYSIQYLHIPQKIILWAVSLVLIPSICLYHPDSLYEENFDGAADTSSIEITVQATKKPPSHQKSNSSSFQVMSEELSA
ncbi:unnamed protein product [Blepharisma stoltei]|uniref:Major facilitator superfamily (MFS) profile domain-containing protein n=1 Tax=Blepharisma stoltei TaxID=1481888 RepID=A0AAU9IL43_9CILI|nr:unnamed protein product [Blepharisma stoltei]